MRQALVTYDLQGALKIMEIAGEFASCQSIETHTGLMSVTAISLELANMNPSALQ